MLRSLLFLLPLIALLGEGQSASALARSSFMALHPRLIASPPIARRPMTRIVTSPPIARRPMTRIVMPWRVRRWAALW
jgi:hypothetical protein